MDEGEMADRLSVPSDAVREAVRQLEEDGTIMGYHALVNEDTLDRPLVSAIIEVEVQPDRDDGFDRVAHTISRFSEVETVYLVSGQYDLRLHVIGESLQQVAAFVASKLAPLEGVKGTATHFLLKKYKEAGFSFVEDERHERLQITP